MHHHLGRLVTAAIIIVMLREPHAVAQCIVTHRGVMALVHHSRMIIAIRLSLYLLIHGVLKLGELRLLVLHKVVGVILKGVTK